MDREVAPELKETLIYSDSDPLKVIVTFTGEAKEYETVPSVSVADSDRCILEGWYSATNGDLSVNAKKLADHSDSPIDLDLSTWKQANLK